MTPPKTSECPLKRGHFKRRGSSSNHLSFRGHVGFRGSGSSPGSLKKKGITQQSSQTKVSRFLTSLAIKSMVLHWQICRFFHPPCCALARSFFGFVGDCFSTQVTYYSEMPKYHDRVPKTSETERTGGDVGDVCGFIWRGRFWIRSTLPESDIAPESGWLEYYFPLGMAYF